MLMAGVLFELVGKERLDAIDQRTGVRPAAKEIGIDDESDSARHSKGDTRATFKEQLDGRWRKAKFAEPCVAANGRDMIVAVFGVGATATRSRHEALSDQITYLALG